MSCWLNVSKHKIPRVLTHEPSTLLGLTNGGITARFEVFDPRESRGTRLKKRWEVVDEFRIVDSKIHCATWVNIWNKLTHDNSVPPVPCLTSLKNRSMV